MKNINPSGLIRLGLHDLEQVESMSGYGVDMGTWHRSQPCKTWVCMAGAVMAVSLKAPKDSSLFPEYFPEQATLLLALNCFRAGEMSTGFAHMKITPPEGFPECWRVPDYTQTPMAFKAVMREIADCLEGCGL